MGFVFLAIIVIVSLLLAVRAWKSYEAEVRRNPSGSAIDPLTFAPIEDLSSSHTQSLQHGDFGCGGAHHSGCDPGGHGGFDGGSHH